MAKDTLTGSLNPDPPGGRLLFAVVNMRLTRACLHESLNKHRRIWAPVLSCPCVQEQVGFLHAYYCVSLSRSLLSALLFRWNLTPEVDGGADGCCGGVTEAAATGKPAATMPSSARNKRNRAISWQQAASGATHTRADVDQPPPPYTVPAVRLSWPDTHTHTLAPICE